MNSTGIPRSVLSATLALTLAACGQTSTPRDSNPGQHNPPPSTSPNPTPNPPAAEQPTLPPGEDTTPPTATMIVNQYEFRQPGTLNITVDAKDASGIAKVQFYKGETLLAEDTTAPYETSVEFKDASQNGEHTYRAWVTDTRGNPAEVKTTVTVNISGTTPPPADTTKPSVTLKASSSTFTAAGTLTLTATASDASGITKVEFFEGNTLLGTDSSAPYTQTVQIDHGDNGTRTYRAVATDTKGNKGEQSVTVTVNVPEPAFDAAWFVGKTWYWASGRESNLSISWTKASKDAEGVTHIEGVTSGGEKATLRAGNGFISFQEYGTSTVCSPLPEGGCEEQYGVMYNAKDEDGKVEVVNGARQLEGYFSVATRGDTGQNPFVLRDQP